MLTSFYTTRQGFVVPLRYADRQAAEQRLAACEAAEARTRECAPTDSGDCRFNNDRETEALHALLATVV